VHAAAMKMETDEIGHREAGAANAPLLSARELTKVYKTGASTITVLDKVDLTVLAGEMIAVLGPSGAGKSTLLHLLAALDTPTSGTVYFEAKALETHRDEAVANYRNKEVGFVWQRHHLLADFTAVENVAMPVLMRNGDHGEALKCAGRWLEEVGLSSRAQHRAAELSGGEQQRVAIARALVNEPAVLLADEPTGDLDEQSATVIMDLIERLHRTHRLTSILATHNFVLAKRCDRVLNLEHGALKAHAAFQQAPSLATEGEKS
jgi:lipoprotein-releasing system ATP-binding protein